MKRTVLSLALASLCFVAQATPGGEGNNTGCNGQGNPNSPCTGSGGAGGAGGSATAGAIGVGVGVANSRSNARSDARASVRSANTVVANPTAVGGSSNAAVGDITISVTTPGTATTPAATDGGKDAAVEAAKVLAESVPYSEPRRPVSTAYAPAVVATSTCMGSASGGMQFDRFGISAGSTVVVDHCETIEIAGVAYRRQDMATGDEVMCGLAKFREARKRAAQIDKAVQPCLQDREDNAKRTAQAVAQPLAAAPMHLLP